MNTLILQLKKVAPLCLIVYALGCLALLPRAQAVSPPLDGDDAAQELGDNTAIGADMLCNMMMLGNTAYGCHALEDNAMGNKNTAIGFNALKTTPWGTTTQPSGGGRSQTTPWGTTTQPSGGRRWRAALDQITSLWAR